MSQPIRVLVVDDSALMRKLLTQVLESDHSIQVVGTAMDGSFGLKKIEELKPHVITLDLEMPRMDGLEMLREITRKHRVPVIVVSAHSKQGAYSTFRALALGAFDFVAKPKDAVSGNLGEIAAQLTSKIKAAAAAGAPRLLTLPPAERKAHKPAIQQRKPATKVVAIGVSTGGPNALQYVFSQLPGDFPGSILVVQHMPEGFTETFARRLDECSAIEVKEAQSGDLLLAGRALICPGDRHLSAKRMPLGDVAVISDHPRVNGHRPSVDILFESVAREFGSNAIAVVMTGMGEDGARGMAAVKAAGGLTMAQSPESCVVDGMPRAAIEKGFATRVVPLDALANALYAQCVRESGSQDSNPISSHPAVK